VSWRKWARVVIAVAGVALAAWLFLKLRHHHPAQAPLSAVRSDSAADYTGVGGAQVRNRDNKETSVTKYARVTHFPDGRTLTEKPEVLFDRGDRKFAIGADRSESKTAPGEDVAAMPKATMFVGHVRVTTSDGFTLACDKASYQADTGIVTVPGLTEFSRGRMSGRGLGSTYDRNSDTLVLQDSVQIDTKPDPQGHGVLHASARALTFARPMHTLNLDDHATIERDGQTMRGDQAMVALTDDDDRIKRMELRNNSSVVQPKTDAGASATTMLARDIDLDFVPDETQLQSTDLRGAASLTQPPTATSKPPQMKAETIHIEFQKDGRAAKRAVMTDRALLTLIGADNAERRIQANAITVLLSADGARATGLNAQGTVIVNLPESADTPGRQIRAETFDATGTDADGLTGAVFKPVAADKNNQVSFHETQKADPKGDRKAISRYLYARQMDLKLNGDIGAIDEAKFLGTFTFKGDDNTTAAAGQSRFVESTGVLVLDANPPSETKAPQVESDRIFVVANHIEMSTKDNGVKASGSITSLLKPDTSKTGPGAVGLFDQTLKVNVFADALDYTDDTAEAAYTGGVHVYQGNNDVRADSVTLSNRTGNLSAQGGVQTLFQLDKSPGSSDTAKPGAPTISTTTCRIAGASCVNATTMVYDDDRRVASYTGQASLVGSGGTAMMADTIRLTLASEGRTLDRTNADGAVVANFSGSVQVQGAHLTYTAGTDTYFVTGRPLTTVRRSVDNKGKESCTTQVGEKLTLAPANDAMKRSDGFLLQTDTGRVINEEQAAACSAVIKVIK
jgi:lipopolysaccharide export system protein LptA